MWGKKMTLMTILLIVGGVIFIATGFLRLKGNAENTAIRRFVPFASMLVGVSWIAGAALYHFFGIMWAPLTAVGLSIIYNILNLSTRFTKKPRE